ncbi:MAG: kanamycin nucleotidyltransferase C-terminal domain-containing protein [candidate division WOR-3 bacterium]
MKRHTHKERAALLKDVIVPMLRKQLGKNLVAIAADGSFARHEDKGYSDLELMIFVKDSKHLPNGFSKIHDGMLIEGLFVTEQEYRRMIHEPNRDWFIAGSDILSPLINHAFIDRLNNYRAPRLAQKCDQAALDMLNEVQESFGKMFNAIEQDNHENLFPILSDAVLCVLKQLAYINRRPYTSLNTIMTEARTLKVKPRGFDEFFEIVTNGEYHRLPILKNCAQRLFLGIEDFFTKKYSSNFYDDDLSSINEKKRRKKRR